MSNEEFFETVNTTSEKNKKSKIGFIKGILLPFISGVFGTILVLAIYLKVPAVKDSIKNHFEIDDSTSTVQEEESKGENLKNVTLASTQNTISLEEYSSTGIFAANKVLP